MFVGPCPGRGQHTEVAKFIVGKREQEQLPADFRHLLIFHWGMEREMLELRDAGRFSIPSLSWDAKEGESHGLGFGATGHK